MSNLFSGNINTNNEYVNMSNLIGFSFVEGQKYTFQFLDPAYIRIGEVGNGFYISNSQPFQYEHENAADVVYIKTTSPGCRVNIAN